MPPKKAEPKKTSLSQGKFKVIGVDPLFPTASFLNIRINFQYEPAPGQSPKDVVNALIDLAEDCWRERYPHMVGKPVESFEEPSQDQEQQNILLSIKNAATIESLQSFRRIAHSNAVFGSAFNTRLEQLKNAMKSSKLKPDASILKEYLKAMEEKNEAAIVRITAIYEINTEDNG